jgi:hypothetical protein
MRNAEIIFGIIRNRGERKLPLEDVYKQLFNRTLYLRAYSRLYGNNGAMTPGITSETVDAMSLEKIDMIIEKLRYERYQWTPVRRVMIAKSSKPKKYRPLGLPTWSDKLVQEVIRSILEAYYEPQFSYYSHGFRPQRGCHTALSEVKKRWRGVKWFIEGDIAQCFDSISHEILLSILSKSLHDNRFIRLVSNLLKAGYLEEWKYNITLSGVPQGSIVSPILSNIYLNELDQFVQSQLLPTYNQGKRRKRYHPYDYLISAAQSKRKTGAYKEAKKLRQKAQQLPSFDPQDSDFRRLWYVRYADDWLLGFIGPRNEALIIKSQIAEFLLNTLKLKLSLEKTLITQARVKSARFLGYEVTTLHSNSKQHPKLHSRTINGQMGLKVPIALIKNKCTKYMRNGKPASLTGRINDTDYSIVAKYQAEYRGFVQYYLMAYNVHRLRQLHYIMRYSLAKTLARKHKTSARKVIRKYQTTVPTLNGSIKALEVRHEREGKKPLVVRFGGIELRWNKQATLYDKPPKVHNNRTEILERLLRDKCEVCGSSESCEVHHIRKIADLNKPGRREKPLWVKRMALRQRKTLVVCKECHKSIHSGKPIKQKVAE